MTAQLSREELKRSLIECNQNVSGMFEVGEDAMCAMMALLEEDSKPYWWAIENRHGDARFIEGEHAKNDIWDEVHELNEKDENGEYFDDNAPYKVVPVYRGPVIEAHEQEPVAWVMADDMSDNSIISTPAYPSKQDAMEMCIPGIELMPLYTHPSPVPAVPDIDTWRTAFEYSERQRDEGFNLHKFGTGYADDATQKRWESWLSSRAAMLNHPEQHLDMVDHSGDVNKKVAPPIQSGNSADVQIAINNLKMSVPEKNLADLKVIEDALQSGDSAQPVTVPAGCVLVPVEPTPEMLTASYVFAHIDNTADSWKAMLAAAPTAPDGWIPVSERMPGNNSYVSVVSRHGEYVSGLVNGEWLDLHDGSSFPVSEIYLWLTLPCLPSKPLPDAPKGV